MYRVDITADLNDEDETGYVWTFLDEARDPGTDQAWRPHRRRRQRYRGGMRGSGPRSGGRRHHRPPQALARPGRGLQGLGRAGARQLTCELAKSGVEIYGHLRTHVKAAIGDGRHEHGLTDYIT